jgi:hypothetical protein
MQSEMPTVRYALPGERVFPESIGYDTAGAWRGQRQEPGQPPA